MEEQNLTSEMDCSVHVPQEDAPAVPETRSSRTTRYGVVNVFKRLRRKNPMNFQKRPQKSVAEPFIRSDDKQAEKESGISVITDTVHGDELSWDGAESQRKYHVENNLNVQTLKPSRLFPHSSAPPIPNSISSSIDPSFSESIETWLYSLSCLAKSKEMDSFLKCSNRLVTSAAQKSFETARNMGEMVVHTALLPATLPLHATASAAGLVFNKGSSALHYFCDNVVPIIVNQSIRSPANPMIADTIDLDTFSKFQDGLRSRKKTVTSKLVEASHLKKEQFIQHEDKFLDRLRLDHYVVTRMGINGVNTLNLNDGFDGESEAVYSLDTDSLTMMLTASMPVRSNYSKFLLRVDDLNINCKENVDQKSQVRVCIVDLAEDVSDERLTYDALNQLAQRGIDIALSNEFVLNMLPEQSKVQYMSVHTIHVHWKPLGQTKKDYNRLKQLSKEEYYDELRHRVCIWTGKYQGNKYHGSENPFFMAQGVVKGNPSQVLDLLWNSKRTGEYNKHCVSREDIFSVCVVDHEAETKNGVFRGAKIIQSETKVPFTNMSVHLSALMCVKLLGNRPEDGIIIFSRSLTSGPKGYHSTTTQGLCQTGNNELIMGINIIRPVLDHPDLSDFISISQVDSSILPPFLKPRIGIMAVEDFFKNMKIALQC